MIELICLTVILQSFKPFLIHTMNLFSLRLVGEVLFYVSKGFERYIQCKKCSHGSLCEELCLAGTTEIIC